MWFTFKFVSLNHWKQLYQDFHRVFHSCDLLSNLYLWTIGNNNHPKQDDMGQLWFTFKFVSLNHWKQQTGALPPPRNCCDLLSNLYLWTIGNNHNFLNWSVSLVVIYFQICIFEPLETTEFNIVLICLELWFTFKFVSLNHWKQH